MSLLEIKNLTTQFETGQGMVSAVRNVSYNVEKGEVLGIVGESGSGKSVGMLTMMGLIASNGKVTSGTITFDGDDISPSCMETNKDKKLYEDKMRKIRGNDIAMIFQDPMTFLNPILKIGTQMTEGIMLHKKCSKEEAMKKAVKLLEMVGIPSPEERLEQFPFEFSGGMRQRIIIAIALSCDPKLIIADEPTTALDDTVQAQFLDIIKTVTEETGTAVIMITHDLGVVATLCQKINIMYGGTIVESGTTDEIFYEAEHPYTLGLLNSINNSEGSKSKPLVPIPGTPPDLLNLPKGCAFMSRCPKAMNICKDYMPPKTVLSDTHSCSCWLQCDDNRAIEIVREGAEAI